MGAVHPVFILLSISMRLVESLSAFMHPLKTYVQFRSVSMYRHDYRAVSSCTVNTVMSIWCV